MEIQMEIGGSLLSLADDVLIDESIFEYNMGFLGGAIFFDSKAESHGSNISIMKSFFFENTG